MVSRNLRNRKVSVIGIDLGTTHSRVGFWIGEELIIRTIPSCIAFNDYTEPVIGSEALDGVDKNPINTILDIKRLIGVNFSSDITPKDRINCPFEVIADPISKNDEPNVIVRSFSGLQRLSGEELLSMILKELKKIAEEILGLENGDVITDAVISVPSCFNNDQRLATKKAATMAGFKESPFYCSAKIKEIQNEDILNVSGRSKSRLRFACEDVKTSLSDPKVTQRTVDVDSYFVISLGSKAVPLSVPVTQDVFDDASKELFDKCEEAIVQCLHDSRIPQIHEVILVGGSTKIPRIREMLRALCSDEKGLCGIVNSDTAVVQGVAIQAAVLSGEALTNPLLNGISIADVAPLSVCARGHGLTLRNLIPRNAMIPFERISRLTARNNQRRLYLGVYEGEVATMEDNNLIGYFIFDGIQPAEMGVRNITVSFAVDHDGILNVSAVEDESLRQLVRQVITRNATADEHYKFGRDMENPEQEVEEESKRKKHEAKLKVWLFTKHMSREVPADFSMGFSNSQVQRLYEAQDYVERWAVENKLPEVRDSELKLDELQRTYFLILQERVPVPKKKNI
ncbi:hypothetical protein MKX01_024584 [Papaver californicum]|nr:hypothetical protein MKX01_024584 [Papaver californicum]